MAFWPVPEPGVTLRAACVQMRTGLDRARNAEDAIALIREAAADGATLVVTPEMTNILDRKTDRLRAAVGPEDSLEEIAAFADLAAGLGIHLVIGSVAVLAAEEGSHLANRSLLFGPEGLIARYDKIHLFDVDLPTGERWAESRTFTGGDEAVVADIGPARLGLSICYDLRFPHLYRALAGAGAEVLTVPAAFTRPTGEAHWEVLLRARAIETGSFVLAAAQGGTHEDGRATWGHSMIISPWGEILAHADGDAPGVIAADLDLGAVPEMRRRIPALTLERPVPVRTFGR